MGIFSINLDKVNLDDDNNYYKNNLETIIYNKYLPWQNEFGKSMF